MLPGASLAKRSAPATTALGLEPGNLAAISSLKLFRAFRFGANVELILTDNRSFRSEPIWDHPPRSILSTALPPSPLAPAGVELIVGSISAPGLFEAMSYKISKDHPLRALYLHEPPAPAPLEPAINCTLLHGVRASLELQRTHDREQALKASNPEVAPHLAFTDVGGHGYAVVRAGADDLEVEFVCVVRPLEKSDRPDGGPLAYRITHRARRWAGGAAPRLERTRVEGALPLSV